MRRSLGFKLRREGQVVPQLAAYLEAAGASTVTSELAIAWAGVQPLQWAHRLGSARAFAKYLRTIDPATEVPPRDVLGAWQHRPAPYLWSAVEICRLLEATGALSPPLRAASHEALFGLLAVSGMRVGEATALHQDDVDLATDVLTIREGKFGRSRLVPLHPTSTEALRCYAAQRDRLCPRPRSSAFLLSSIGTALSYSQVHKTFSQLRTAIGFRIGGRPRIHD